MSNELDGYIKDPKHPEMPMYRITINLKHTVTVWFPDNAIKDDFVHREMQYCIKEEKDYFSSISKKDREETLAKLNEKRYEHAKARGYTSLKTNAFVLVKPEHRHTSPDDLVG